ncbi:GTPase-activator protein [Histomonas meleagridis]|uniref:GTPase-activator protein n=1 Tax=Histomonas meleagridis TaxID=135588 RepID=UPI003559C03A|nr:GTPase-activator protein [Histomonas meleagridis]KAH0801667.1 GTPase-activator protein [Histomonas meleagridis]
MGKNSLTPEKAIKNVIDELTVAIDTNAISHASQNTDPVLPSQFVEKFYQKQLILLHKFSNAWIGEIIKQLLEKTDSILMSQKQKTWDFNVLYQLCIYYRIASSCINTKEPGAEEIADPKLCELVIKQSTIILSSDFGRNTYFVHAHFSAFLGSFGSHSRNVYNLFFQKLQHDFVSNVSAKQLYQMLKPWIHMSYSVKYLHYSLEPISTKLGEVPKSFRQPYCNMITETVLMAFKRDIVALVDFLNKGEELTCVQSIIDTIVTWNEKSNYFAWPTQLLLEMLIPSKLGTYDFSNKKSFHGRLVNIKNIKGSKKDTAIATLLTGFRATVYSNCNDSLCQFMDHFYDSFLKYYTSGKREYKESELNQMAHIDFPMYCLWRHPDDFNTKLIPIYFNEKSYEMRIYLSRMIRRICKQISFFQNIDKDFLQPLIEPTITIISRTTSDSKSIFCIQQLLIAFQASPDFFRMIIFQKPETLKLLFKVIQKEESLTPQNAFLCFFDSKYVESTIANQTFYDIVSQILEFLNETYQKITLYRRTSFSHSIPEVLLQITEFLTLHFQNEQFQDKENKTIVFKILTYLENDAILFLASSNKDIRLKGVSILSSLLEIVHSSEMFLDFNLPVSEYQSLVTEAHRVPILKTADNSIKIHLKVIYEEREAMDNAFNTLFPYFLALTKAINPKIELVQQPQLQVQHPIEMLQEEWIGTISILFTIVFQQFYMLSKQMKIILHDDGDLGACISSAVPTAFSVKDFNPIMGLINNWVAAFQHPDGSFDVNHSTSTFIQNALKVVRGLAEQKQWTPNLIAVNIFGPFMKRIVSYCGLVQGEILRLPCVQAIISLIKLLNKNSKDIEPIIKHQIAKTFIGWLPTKDNPSKHYESLIYEALSLLLDNLSLIDCIDSNDPKTPEQQASSQFLFYFASIKNRLDLPQTIASEIIPVLASLLKKNLSIGIEHCISMGFANNDNVRAAFISAVASVFKVPEAKILDETSEQTNDTLIDFIFTGNWEFVEFICSCIPYSRAEIFGAAMVESAIIRKVEYEFLEKMISVEVESSDEASKNTLFRGNAVPARAVGHFPKIVGTEWMTQTLRPVFEEVIEKCKNGVSYQIDPNKLEAGENLEKNQQNFRDLLNECIDKILSARNSMPESLVYESQMIYQKVSEKYGDFSIQILSGFLFLRFLLPAFSVPKLVGLPDVLPPKPRAALLMVSTVLMAATLHGHLNQKGTPSTKLPLKVIEGLSQPDSVHKAIINTIETNVRLHSHSIQFAGQTETLGNYKITPLKVILLDEIKSRIKPHLSQTNSNLVEFGFSTKEMVYSITITKNSPLAESFLNLYNRSKIIKNVESQSYVKIDSSTLHWLMLNIAFINLMNDDVKNIVKKAALDLISATYASFQFNHTINIANATTEALPLNMIGYAQLLSDDLAKNNSDSFSSFLTEYFKAYQYIDKYKNSTLLYLKSWIEYYSLNIDKYPQFMKNIFETFKELAYDSHAFVKFIWPSICINSHSIELFMNNVYKLKNDEYIEMVTGFASIKPDLISKFWCDTVFKPPYKNDDSTILFICRVWNVLFSNHLFDVNYIPWLIYNISQMRLEYSSNVLRKCAPAFVNAIHFIIYISGSSLPMDTSVITKAFANNPQPDDLKEFGRCYPWLKNTAAIASVFNNVLSTLPERTIQNNLLEIFSNDFDSDNKLRKSQSIIFACAFAAQSNAESLTRVLIDPTGFVDPIITNAVCIGLSLIKMDQTLSAKLFITGIIMTLTLCSSSGIDLIFSSLYQYSKFDDCNNIINHISNDVLNYLNECTSLPFINDIIYSALIIVSIYCDSVVAADIKKLEMSNINNYFVKVFCLANYQNKETINELCNVEFGDKSASINAALLMLLRMTNSDSLAEYLEKRLRASRESFSAFPVLNAKFIRELFENVKNSSFLSLLVMTAQFPSQKYTLEPMLLPYYYEGMKEVKLNIEQCNYLLALIFG